MRKVKESKIQKISLNGNYADKTNEKETVMFMVSCIDRFKPILLSLFNSNNYF